jgi:hypothetical protein
MDDDTKKGIIMGVCIAASIYGAAFLLSLLG